MTKSFVINGRIIGPDYPPYIIAEMSANHNGNINSAYRIIEEAKKSGADAVKLQTYRPDTITLKSNLPDFQVINGLWAGHTLYDLYEWAHTPWEWHKPLFEYARKLDITIFSSPFDYTAVDFLEDLNVPAYKIASFEAVDIPLIEYVASTGKPMIISTGMANLEEIEDAIDAARGAGCKELALLHCVSGYPAPASDYNLRTITDMRERFRVPIGLSDHSLTNTTALASIPLGSSIIEKHFTLDRSGGGADDSFSQEPSGLRELCSGAVSVWESLGKIDYELKDSEKANQQFRRSLYFVKDIEQGETITNEHVRSIRPGYGLPPKELKKILGRKVNCDINRGTPTSYQVVESNQ